MKQKETSSEIYDISALLDEELGKRERPNGRETVKKHGRNATHRF